jgi:hypothetical protein
MRFDYVVLFGKGDLMAQPREWYSQFQFASSAWMQACPIKIRKQIEPSRKSRDQDQSLDQAPPIQLSTPQLQPTSDVNYTKLRFQAKRRSKTQGYNIDVTNHEDCGVFVRRWQRERVKPATALQWQQLEQE